MLTAHRLPVLSCAESAALEAVYIKQKTGNDWKLMKRAADGLARQSLEFLNRAPKKILVLVGTGNNGADALLAAVLASNKATRITAVFISKSANTRLAKKVWKMTGKKIEKVSADKIKNLYKTNFCLIFDGLTRSGIQSPLTALK
jgi:NAD(P)H-hydrate repair Nnr-like enzyme with NAD(P)H-hydrate epimerase domain